MRYLAASIVCVACLTAAVRADDEFDQLNSEYRQAYENWVHQFATAPKNDDGSIRMDKIPPNPARKFVSKFKAYAEKHAGKPEALPALIAVMDLAAQSGESVDMSTGRPDANWAIGELTDHYAADPGLSDGIEKLQRAGYTVTARRLVKFYQAVIDKNPDRETKATAKFGLAMHYLQPQFGIFGQAPDTKPKAAKLLRELDKDFKDTQAGQNAAGYIYEMDHLQVGQIAPDFEGKDADGNTIKLSQFRGKIVMLDYWGYW